MNSKHLINIVVDKPIQFVRTLLENKKSADLFLEISEYLIKNDPLLIVRTDCSTIGLSRPGERYLFYVATGKDALICKFKHWEKAKTFPSDRFQYYRSCCDEAIAYYTKCPEQFQIGIVPPQAQISKQPPDITKPPVCGAENIPQTTPAAVGKQEKAPTTPEKSCATCFLRISEQCSSLANVLCDDYRPRVCITQEEMSYWPTGGDATASREDFRIRYHRGRST